MSDDEMPGLWRRFTRMLGSHRARKLHLPPEPPLLTKDAVEAVLREVGLLLDYLNRLPESKLQQYFPCGGAVASASIAGATPPCATYAYFLDRIASIAALGPSAKAEAVTQPASGGRAAAAGRQDDGQCDGTHLGDLAFLIWTRDFLTSVAAPATLDTIRVTRAFRARRAIGAEVDPGSPRTTGDERDLFMSRYGLLIAKRVSRFTVLAFVLLWSSLYISYLVYAGQMLLQENAGLRAAYAAHEARVKEAAGQEEQAIQIALRKEQPSDLPTIARAYCDITIPGPPAANVVRMAGSLSADEMLSTGSAVGEQLKNMRLYVSERQRALCTEYKDLVQRRRELVETHRRWWDHSVLLRRITQPDVLFNPRHWFQSRSELVDWHLETFRYRMEQMINGLLAGIMPAMYAALGALASMFRRLAEKVSAERLGPSDYSGMLSSLVLGILTGAVIGLFTSVFNQSAHTTGLPLSTTALALLAGYATNTVFGLFDSLADRVFRAPEDAMKRTAG